MRNKANSWSENSHGQSCDNYLATSLIKTLKWKATMSTANLKCQKQMRKRPAGNLWRRTMLLQPVYTPPFGSNQSAQLSMRPADRQWRRSITPSSILKNRQFHPISPLSENHPQRPGPLPQSYSVYFSPRNLSSWSCEASPEFISR